MSFSKAAKALGVSKSHISKSIQTLEQELGVALLSRSTRKVQLTPRGEDYYRHCRASIAGFELARASVLSSRDAPSGLLRISLAGIFGESYIAPVAMEMMKKYPELRIELNFDMRFVDLIEEKFDLAIRIGSLPDSSLRAIKLASRREFVCCSPAYAASHPAIHAPKDLLQHNCLGDGPWTFHRAQKSLTIAVKGKLKTNNPRVAHAAALQGFGIAKLPGSYVFQDISEGRLLPLLSEYTEDTKDIWVVMAQKTEMNINIRTFVNELKTVFERDLQVAQF